ncbi:MAG TPA: hypothetical protein VHI31_06475 [Actinomycetota bacterium]|nr:hypothetical protein [Actinomycetota bacterium]
MKKTVVMSFVAVAVLAVGAFTAFFVTKGDTAAEGPAATASADASKSAAPVVPNLDLPAGGNDAQLLTEINQIILDVTQQAVNEPKEERMSSEEVAALIRSRIDDLKQREEQREG